MSPPWETIKFNHEVLGKPIDDLCREFGVSEAEIAYAAEVQRWGRHPGGTVNKPKDPAEAAYLSLELELLTKIKAILSNLQAQDDASPAKIKLLSECYKMLRYGEREASNAGNIQINVINAFAENEVIKTGYQRIRNVTNPGKTETIEVGVERQLA